MPHILNPDMNNAFNAMFGNASTGSSIAMLKAVTNAVDALIGNSTIEVTAQAHEFCDKVSSFLLGDYSGYASGRGSKYDVDAMISEGNGILNA